MGREELMDRASGENSTVQLTWQLESIYGVCARQTILIGLRRCHLCVHYLFCLKAMVICH